MWRVRFNAEHAAEFFNVTRDDITTLMRKGLLIPLGHPRPSAVKYFAFVVLERLAADVNWLSRATDALYAETRRKNALRKLGAGPTSAKDKTKRRPSTGSGDDEALGDGSGS